MFSLAFKVLWVIDKDLQNTIKRETKGSRNKKKDEIFTLLEDTRIIAFTLNLFSVKTRGWEWYAG